MDQWGWNPATFTAVGTVGAAFTATIALLIALRQYRNARVTARSAQASLVSVWISHEEFGLGRGQGLTGFVITVHNASTQPVMSPSLLMLLMKSVDGESIATKAVKDWSSSSASSAGPWPLWPYTRLSVGIHSWPGRIDPGGTLDLLVEAVSTLDYLIPLRKSCGLVFRDARGNPWTLRPDGHLFPGVRLR